ncbi:hypothetical protein [Thiohalophilus sp.]|uniref:hypothetical protein n=1 Tax=Thiohalophilus sp. TaxID=3028392 RepID=UPI002ACEECEF|nr:hypothetical protein [Thiohalophilus sp.]MDZ7804410.1 hypothetical protein [Thiohalophilus sp.]
MAISSAYFLNPRIEDTGRILVDTMQGISSGDVSGKNARPQVWAATYLTLSENPWFGVGSKIHESFYKYGAVKERDGYVNVRAPQGSIPGVMLRSGVIFGILYTLSFLILLYRFVVMINTYRPVAYGGISLLVGGGIVQFGGDFFIQIMFIVTLGYFLSIGSSRHTTIQDSYSGYHEK